MRTSWPLARRAVSGGRFVTGGTFLAVSALSLTVLAPLPAGLSAGERALVGAAAAAAVSLLWALVGVLERVLTSARGRAALIAAALLVTAVARPPLQDAFSRFGGLPVPSADDTVLRMATNLVVWTIGLAGTAALAELARSTRETNALLRRVLAQWEGSATRVRAYTAAARADIAATADALATVRMHTTADVRALALDLRSRARALSDRAAQPPPLDDPTGAGSAPARPRPARGLRLPPPGFAGAVYAVAVLPYALQTVGALDLILGFVAAIVCGAAADLAARMPPLRRRPRVRAAVFVIATVLVGLVLSAVAYAQDVPAATAALAAPAYSALAIALAAGRTAVHNLRVERRRLSSALVARGRADDLGTRRVRAALHRAADLVHADAQGTAVQFVLRHPDATPAEVASFADGLRPLVTALRATLDAPPVPDETVSLEPLLQTWGTVLPLRTDVPAEAARVLREDPALARDVVDVVAEGLLNAAKHARTREAVVEVHARATAAGPRLRVRVVSPGPPAAGARLREGSRAERLGARLRAEGSDAVLEAVFAIADTDGTARSVVSTEHSEEPANPRA